MASTGHDRLLIEVPHKNWGSGRLASVSRTLTRPCFAHCPDYSSVLTQGLGRTQYNCSDNSRIICNYRALAYRAGHNISILSCFMNTTNSYM